MRQMKCFPHKSVKFGLEFRSRIYSDIFHQHLYSVCFCKKPPLTQAHYVPQVINLTVADLLVGAVTGPLLILSRRRSTLDVVSAGENYFI